MVSRFCPLFFHLLVPLLFLFAFPHTLSNVCATRKLSRSQFLKSAAQHVTTQQVSDFFLAQTCQNLRRSRSNATCQTLTCFDKCQKLLRTCMSESFRIYVRHVGENKSKTLTLGQVLQDNNFKNKHHRKRHTHTYRISTRGHDKGI